MIMSNANMKELVVVLAELNEINIQDISSMKNSDLSSMNIKLQHLIFDKLMNHRNRPVSREFCEALVNLHKERLLPRHISVVLGSLEINDTTYSLK